MQNNLRTLSCSNRYVTRLPQSDPSNGGEFVRYSGLCIRPNVNILRFLRDFCLGNAGKDQTVLLDTQCLVASRRLR